MILITYNFEIQNFSILEKFDGAKRENEQLKSRLAELENSLPL